MSESADAPNSAHVSTRGVQRSGQRSSFSPERSESVGLRLYRHVGLSDKSAIEWTEATWNPVTGCDRVSEGCDHCYAQTLAKRLKAMGSRRYQRDGDPRTSGPGFGVTLHPDQLTLPMRWRAPRTVFVNSMRQTASVPGDARASPAGELGVEPEGAWGAADRMWRALRRSFAEAPRGRGRERLGNQTQMRCQHDADCCGV